MTSNNALASAILGALLVARAAGKSAELNPSSFDEVINSKNAFIKFYAPWCGHCKALAPDWDDLADKYASSSSVFIGSVDCTSEDNDDLCHQYGVQGYPTLKYFKDGDTEGEDYQGGRSPEDLEEFVDGTLNKKCVVGTEEEMGKEESNCSEKERDYARKMRAKTSEERKAQIARLDKMKTGTMKAELKAWIFQRLHVLNGLEAGDGHDEF